MPEIIKYIVAGAIAFSIDASTLYALTKFAHIHYLLANFVGYTSGLIIVYFLNIKWVFSVRKYDKSSIEFTIFVIIAAIGLAISEAIMWGLVEKLLTNYMIAKAFASAFVVIFNYIARKFLLFTQ